MYYKILNSKWNHHEFQYKLGLNIDTIPFNPTGSCQSGGLYYTDEKHIVKFFEYGCDIAEVEIPEDANVYKDPREDKWKADKLIILRVYPIADWDKWRDPAFCLEAVRQDGCALRYVKEQTHEICLEAVRRNGRVLRYVKEQTHEICLGAVRQDGLALQYVKEQTHEICLEAVRQDGCAICYVKDQTHEICLEAVRQNGIALQYVKEQTHEICLGAVRQDGWAICYVKEQTHEICLEAIKQKSKG